MGRTTWRYWPNRGTRVPWRTEPWVVRERKIESQQDLRSTSNDTLWIQSPWKCVQVRLPGFVFATDGLQDYDIRVPIGKTMSRCGNLDHLFDSPDLGSWLKIRLYVVSVVSVVSLLTYGCESWNLTEAVIRKLNGVNSQMLSRITGNDVRDETRSVTSSFDIVKHIRVLTDPNTEG